MLPLATDADFYFSIFRRRYADFDAAAFHFFSFFAACLFRFRYADVISLPAADAMMMLLPLDTLHAAAILRCLMPYADAAAFLFAISFHFFDILRYSFYFRHVDAIFAVYALLEVFFAMLTDADAPPSFDAIFIIIIVCLIFRLPAITLPRFADVAIDIYLPIFADISVFAFRDVIFHRRLSSADFFFHAFCAMLLTTLSFATLLFAYSMLRRRFSMPFFAVAALSSSALLCRFTPF